MSKPRYRPTRQGRPENLQSGGTRATDTPSSAGSENASGQALSGNDAEKDRPASV
ncbi:MAG: hypothetical protein AAFY78_17165 [Cyanobacteria bacterium J06648_16]